MDEREKYLEYLRRIVEGDDNNDEEALNHIITYQEWLRRNL